MLVCDQMEELWAPGVDPAERDAFLDTVLGLMDDGIVVRCVAVVRGDHVGRLAEHAAFTERARRARSSCVPPLTDPELREIVREPAVAVGLDGRARTAGRGGRRRARPARCAAAALDRPGRHVGTAPRRRCSPSPATSRPAGWPARCTRTAETAYAALGREDQEYARRLLVRLADVDDGGALVRRRLPLAELDLDGGRGIIRGGGWWRPSSTVACCRWTAITWR